MQRVDALSTTLRQIHPRLNVTAEDRVSEREDVLEFTSQTTS